jgi:hypothetical protein
MPNAPISGLTTITGATVAVGDLFEVLDISDATFAGTGTNKKISFTELVTALSGSLQPKDATLTGLAATTVSAADRYLYSTGTDAFTTGTITSFMRTLLDDADATTAQSTLALPSLTAGNRSSINTAIPGQVSIDVSLSGGLSGGDTLIGGTASGDPLTIGSTSHTTRGVINLRDQVEWMSEDKTQSSGSTPFTYAEIASARTLTLSSGTAAGNQFRFLQFSPTIVYGATSATFASFAINIAPIVKNDTTSRTVNTCEMINVNPTYRADTGTLTISGPVHYQCNPSWDVINGGTNTAGSGFGYSSTGVVNTGVTLAGYAHYSVGDLTGSGTVSGVQVGIDIPTLAKGGTNIGIRNAASTQWIPTTKAITAATDTIPITASVIRLNNTSGGSVTLGTTTPVMADGTNGQIIIIFNSSAQPVVLPDQSGTAGSNLRLAGAANLTLGTNDSVTVMFNTNINDWIQIGASNN